MGKPTRPILRFHGGKWRLAPWIVQHLPPHRVYVEPFGGAASVLLRKPRSYAEIYNDLDSEIVNLFRVLRDPELADELIMQLWLTPFARDEFELSYVPTEDKVEQARRTVARSYMGFGSAAATGQKTGFRANSNRTGTTPAHDWGNFPASLRAVIERLRGVVIEQRPAIDVIQQHDSPKTLHYCDPPYPASTRSQKKRTSPIYRHEMTDDEHRELAEALRSVQRMVVLSGYPCKLYDEELYPDWIRTEREALADGARRRTEVLWISPSVLKALPLFNWRENETVPTD